MTDTAHSVLFDAARCNACVACTKACPARAIRVRGGAVRVDRDLCIDCGECIRACPRGAVRARTSVPSDLGRFPWRIAVLSTTLFAQFGRDVRPDQVVAGLTKIGFNDWYDLSWMCEMVAGAVDTYLSECQGPWPKLSVTCPAIVRLVQLRYPDLLQHLVPIEAPRELAARLVRRKAAHERGLRPDQIGVFYTTPCSAIMQSIASPVGLDASYLNGAFSIAELYGPLLAAIREGGTPPAGHRSSPQGLGWAVAGGQSAMMRDRNTLTVSGLRDVIHVFDRIESGKFEGVDFIEAYICPDGCVSGPLLVEGRYAARRTMQWIAHDAGTQGAVKEEKVRSMFREHFFDLQDDIRARAARPRTTGLRQAVQRRQEKTALVARLPGKDCGACGAPDCATLADDVLDGAAGLDDCVFLKLGGAVDAARPPEEGVG